MGSNINQNRHIAHQHPSNSHDLLLFLLLNGTQIASMTIHTQPCLKVFNGFFIVFLKKNEGLRITDMSLLVVLSGVPSNLIAVFSIPFANRFGFKFTLRLALIFTSVSSLIASQLDNFYLYAFFSAFILSLCYGLTSTPLMYCLWSHFPKKTGAANGLSLSAFNLSTLFVCIMAVKIINPDNMPASIPFKEGSNVIKSIHLFISQSKCTINLHKELLLLSSKYLLTYLYLY